jgi:uncharacterized protein involved in tolerance to divalent cations
MSNFYQVWFSAENKKQAQDILRGLVKLKLIVGGTVLHGPSQFWWKRKIIDMDYFYVVGFTTDKNIKAIKREYIKISKEEIPMASFVKTEGNKKFLDYISKNTNQK